MRICNHPREMVLVGVGLETAQSVAVALWLTV